MLVHGTSIPHCLIKLVGFSFILYDTPFGNTANHLKIRIAVEFRLIRFQALYFGREGQKFCFARINSVPDSRAGRVDDFFELLQ